MVQRIFFGVIVTLILLVLGAALTGALIWKIGTGSLISMLKSSGPDLPYPEYNLNRVENLPEPVLRYFRKVLPVSGQRIMHVEIRHSGTFNMGEDSNQWKRFESVQQVRTRRPGFIWNAKIRVAPFLPVRVHDAYIAGDGILKASLLGLFPIVNERGKEDLARGELMRYLAEAVWYPTALLPESGVQWSPIDSNHAEATLSDAYEELSLVFTFNDQGLVETVDARERGRKAGNLMIPTPWRGRFWNYREYDGVLIPVEGEVSWILPDGARPYWRGRIDSLDYIRAE